MTDKEPFLTEKEIVKPHGLLPISRQAFRNGIKKGIYPEPIHFGKKIVWKKEEILIIRERGTK